MINAYKVSVRKHKKVGSRREYKIKVDLEGYHGMSGLDPFDLGQRHVANLINTFMDRGVRYDAAHFLII
jgi:hypothetical protein